MRTGRKLAVREFLAAAARESGAAANPQRVADHTTSSVGRPRQSAAVQVGTDRTPKLSQKGDAVREWPIRNSVCSTTPTRPHTSAMRKTPKRMSRVPFSFPPVRSPPNRRNTAVRTASRCWRALARPNVPAGRSSCPALTVRTGMTMAESRPAAPRPSPANSRLCPPASPLLLRSGGPSSFGSRWWKVQRAGTTGHIVHTRSRSVSARTRPVARATAARDSTSHPA